MPETNLHDLAIDDRLPGVLDALGGEAFPAALFGWLQGQFALDEVFVFERPLDPAGVPRPVLSRGRGPSAGERARAYCEDFHQLDPINDLIERDGEESRVVVVSPRDIPDRSYRSLCYDRPEFIGKASFWRRRSSHWLVVSMFRSAEAGPFQGPDLGAIGRCARLLSPLIAKHRALRRLEPTTSREPRLALIARVEGRLADLPTRLTPRQLAVCARTAIGMTAEGIGLDLGVKASSVVTHRRRAYDRLGVATGFELTRLLI